MAELDPNVDWGKVADTIDKIKARFPAYSWLLSNPEVENVLLKAVAQEWTPDTFAANLKATDWWKSTNDAQRQAQAYEATNPGEATKKVNALKVQITQAAGAIGGGLDDQTAGSLAWQAFRNGWSDDEIRQAVQGHTANVPGKESINVDQVAAQYMVDLSPSQKLDYARQLNTGALDAGSFQNLMKEQSKSRFPTLAEYIDKGITPKNFFAPYQQLVSNLTGVTAESVNLTSDPTWMKMISTADPKTGTLRPQTLDEATKTIRGSDQFANSDNGKAEAAQFSMQLGKAIGAMK